MARKSNDTASSPKQITHYLIKKYGDRLGFDLGSFPEYCDTLDYISALGVKNILSGKTKKFTKETSIAMCKIFSPVIPRVKYYWFLKSSKKEFVARCEPTITGENKDAIPKISLSLNHGADANFQTIKEEIYDQLIDRSFLTYRFAFEDTGRLAKELLTFYEEEGEIRFSYFFRVNGDPKTFVRECKGGVLFISDNILLIGVYTNLKTNRSRFRSLLLKSESTSRDDNISKYNHRIGILTSGLPEWSHGHNSEPAGTLVYLERIQQRGLLSEQQIDDYVNWIEKDDMRFHPKAEQILKCIANETKNFVLYTDTNDVNFNFT